MTLWYRCTRMASFRSCLRRRECLRLRKQRQKRREINCNLNLELYKRTSLLPDYDTNSAPIQELSHPGIFMTLTNKEKHFPLAWKSFWKQWRPSNYAKLDSGQAVWYDRTCMLLHNSRILWLLGIKGNDYFFFALISCNTWTLGSSLIYQTIFIGLFLENKRDPTK